MAFNTGVCVSRMKMRLAPVEDMSRAWLIMATEVSAATAVEKFREESDLPVTALPFITACTPNGVAISGPPRSLDALVSSVHFRGVKHKVRPVYAPYHAPHLYTREDVKDILAPLRLSTARLCMDGMYVLMSTGNDVQGSTFRDRIAAAVEHVLLWPILWDGIFRTLRTRLGERKTLQAHVFGSGAQQVIYAAMGQRPGCDSSLKGPVSLKQQSNPQPTQSRPKIAIIGMSGRFPGSANSNEAFWELLHRGLDVHEEVPPLHWSKAHVDASRRRKNTSATPYGCWLSDPASFDARFFNMSPREAPQVDPAQRLALMTAYEALEQAGVVPDATPSTRRDRVGVFYGVTSNDWMETNSSQDIDTYFVSGGNRAFIPGRINYFFKFTGPSFAVDAACSSSLAAVHAAVNSLWQGDVDMAVAGGTNVMTNPDHTAGLDRGHFLSHTGNCRAFDDTADGYCRGEGVGTVVLKRLDDALAEKDPVLGIILGAYTNHSAQAESITRPHTGAQRAIFSKILNSSAVDPQSVGYVEMHGTGTQAGDATEMSSVLSVFAPEGRVREQPVFLGSTKACIGHGEAASGVSSLIKVLLMMKHCEIPPHVGIKTRINRKFPTDLAERNVHIANEPVSWVAGDSQPRRAFVNNFSAAGGNSALLLEEAPTLEIDEDEKGETAQPNLIAVSAKTASSLQGNLLSLKTFLAGNRYLSIGQLSYTTTARRIHHPHRVMLIGSSVNDLVTQIHTVVQNQPVTSRPKTPKIVFAFTGQGAQFPGMGYQLLQTFSVFRTEIQQLDRIACSQGFPSIMLMYAAPTQGRSLDDFTPLQVQLASVCMQIAIARLWASWGIFPQAVVGHSLGEYAALNVAGVLSDSDVIHLIGTRAKLLQERCKRGTHAMLVVRAPIKDIAAAFRAEDTTMEVACLNSPTETVMAGSDECVSAGNASLEHAGIKTTRLNVPYAYHSYQVDPILPPFKMAAASARYLAPKCPVICPLNGSIVTDEGTFGPAYLARHCREPVNLLKALQSARHQEIITDQSIFLEIGPHPAVSTMVKATLGPQTTVVSTLNRTSARDVLADALKEIYQAGVDVDWAAYHSDFKASQRVVVGLPAYSWDLKPYWIQYVNDWSLRKGDPPLVADAKTELESTTIHRVVKDSSSDGGVKEHLVVEADISRPDMSPLVQGHRVDDFPLCTPSVYAEMALTLGRHLVDRRGNSDANNQVDVSNMTILKALIAKPQGPQLLQARADVDWAKNEAAMKFVSFDAKGNPQEHATCTLRFTDHSLMLTKLQRNLGATKRRMQALRRGIAAEKTARFTRPMVYRMIRPLAQFHEDYRAIDEVILDSTTLEASAIVSFGSIKRAGNFALHPAIIDAFSQSSAFAMNCNDNSDVDKDVFMNHGWGRFQVFRKVHFDRPYTSYTRMAEGKDDLWHGDVVIYDGEIIVAAIEQIALQCVPRRVLRAVLSLESGIKSKKPAPAVPPGKPFQETPAVPAAISPAPSSSRVSTALQIISEESGVALAELTDECAFADLGVDSLLGLTISARFRDELDLDFEGFFVAYPTIGDLIGFIEPAGISCNTKEPPTTAESLKRGDPNPGETSDFSRVLGIISEESGVALHELTDDALFADIGVDSLLSLVIASRFREELELDMPIDSLFVDCPRVGDLKRCLGDVLSSPTRGVSAETHVVPEESPMSSSDSSTSAATPSSSEASSDTATPEECRSLQTIVVPRSTSLVLQGSSRTATKTLFLFPDGGGTACSYAAVPKVAHDTCVVALNCPFLWHANCLRAVRLDDVISNGYLAEIRRRQPEGPYHLGGWSAGGILAYRAAQILMASGQKVLSLSLIDSPCPLNGLDRLPPHFYEYCESLHLFGHNKSTPLWLIPHFNATIDLLHEYHAAPMPRGPLLDALKVNIVWAASCIADNQQLPRLPSRPGDTKGMKFLLERRTDFGPNGWDVLFPGREREVVISRVEGGHHFSMMVSFVICLVWRLLFKFEIRGNLSRVSC